MLKKILFVFVALYALLGFIILPWMAPAQISKIVAQETNAAIKIEHISFNPFLFKLQIHNVLLQSKQGKPLVAFKTLGADVELYSLFAGTVHLQNIFLDKPELFVQLSKEKKLNLLGIVKEQKTKQKRTSEKASKLPRIRIDGVKISNGVLHYEDDTKKEVYTFDLHDIAFSLKNFDTKNRDVNSTTLSFFSTLEDGGALALHAKILGLTPLRLDATVHLTSNKLYTEWKYLKEMLNFEIADGKLSFQADFHLDTADFNATLLNHINASIEKLRLVPKKGHKDILTLHNLSLFDASVAPFKQVVRIKKIAVDTLHLHAQRNRKNAIDLLQYFQVKSVQNPNNKGEKQADPWSVQLQELAINNVSANFKDSAISPHVVTQLNTLNIHAKEISFAGEKPLSYKLDFLLNESLKCRAEGTLVHKVLQSTTHLQCQNFDLVHYRPYIDAFALSALKKYNVKMKSARIDLDTKVTLKKHNSKLLVTMNETNASLKHLRLSERKSKKRVLSLEAFKVSDLALDVTNKAVQIGKVSLYSPKIYAVLDKKARMNFEDLIVAKQSKKAKKSKQSKPFSFLVKHFAIYNAKVDFQDKTVTPAAKQVVDRIYFHAYNIDAKKYSWLRYRLSSRINKQGKLFAQGQFRHTPLKEKGSLKLTTLPLQSLSPYVQKKAFLKVADGKLSLAAKTAYELAKKSPDLRLEGSVWLEDFFLNDSRNALPVFSINDVNVSAFTFELNPNRLYVDRVDLKSFYIDALIDKNKEMNYAKLIKPSENNSTAETNTTQFPVKIAKVNIVDGNAKFADLSIPLQFKTDIHDLNGAIYSISNDGNETSYVDIDGEVDAYGSTKLKGSINSANPKEFTDLNFNFQNIDLHALSGYSASFAGYEIAQGKLSLDLGYKIKNSELLGANNIVIQKIKLGKENSDANVTKLPLGFVIGLLEDSDGVIDIDMPVEGNVDAPDFKYGALVWKTFGKLIVRAVTSPFRFLGALMGLDGDTLSYVEFETGSSKITPTQREKIDNIAKMMRKKPKVVLELTPHYDIKQDRLALQKKKLITLVMQKSGISNEKEHESAMNVAMLEEIYKTAKEEASLAALEEKMHTQTQKANFHRAYLEALIQACTDMQEVSQDELLALAQHRVLAIQKYLVHEKLIDTRRIVIKSAKKVENSTNSLVKIGLNIEVK